MDDIVDIVAMAMCTGGPLPAHAGSFSTTLQIEVTVSQSDWHKVGSVDDESTNHGSRNCRLKMHGKMKHS